MGFLGQLAVLLSILQLLVFHLFLTLGFRCTVLRELLLLLLWPVLWLAIIRSILLHVGSEIVRFLHVGYFSLF